MSRKRILYYSHTRQVSGGERVLLTMLSVLDREQYEPLCACPFTGSGNLDEVLRAHGEQVLEAPALEARFTSNPLRLAQYVGSFVSAIRSFRKSIATVKPDLLHANSVRAGIVATLATTGTHTKVLWHIHDDLPAHPISTAIRHLAFRSRRSRFVAVSHATARVFAGGMPFGFRLQVLHNAVDTARFPRKISPLDPAAQAFRSELGIAGNDFLITSIGMINPRKGQLELVQVWADVQSNLAHLPASRKAHLAIVGAPLFNKDYLYEQRVHELARPLDTRNPLHFTGSRQDIPAILRASDLFVLNAAVEPFGLVLLEAIASGTPIVATDVGGIPEIVQGSLTADLVGWQSSQSYRATEQLAPALLGPIRDATRANAMADRAYVEVLPQFTIPVFAANLQALYTSHNLGGPNA